MAVAAGEDNSLALTSDGDLYGWGDGQNGQLCRSARANEPARLASGPRRYSFSPPGQGSGCDAKGWLHGVRFRCRGMDVEARGGGEPRGTGVAK